MSAVSGNAQVYAWGAGKFSQTLKSAGVSPEITQFTDSLPQVINGSYDPTGQILDAIPMNQDLKLIVGSALDILKTWLMHSKGADIKEASEATNKAQQSSNQIKSDVGATQRGAEDITSQTKGDVDAGTGVMQGTAANNEELNEQNNTLTEQNNALTGENEESQKQIDAETQKRDGLIQKRNALMGELKRLGFNTEQPEQPAAPSATQDGNSDAPATSAAPAVITAPADASPEMQALIASINDFNGQIAECDTYIANWNNTITKNNTLIAGNKETIEANTATQAENNALIGQAADGIMDTISSGKAAITDLTNIMSGKQKMFTKEQVVNAGTQAIKAAINGTEAGVLTTIASAAGLSSLASFGATASQAAQAAEAAADKFASVPARLASEVAIKTGEALAKKFVQQGLAQLSEATGVNFSQMYSDAMEIYSMASSVAPDAKPSSSEGNSGSSGSSGTQGQSNTNGQTNTPPPQNNKKPNPPQSA